MKSALIILFLFYVILLNGSVSAQWRKIAVSKLGSVPGNPGIECYEQSPGGGQQVKKGGPHQTSEPDTLTTEQCIQLANTENQLHNSRQFQKDYDTIKAYITLCYDQHYSEDMFGGASEDVDAIGDTIHYDEFREWLKSVLYLRTDSAWYCADVYRIAHTFLHYPGHRTYLNGMEAVIRYILDNNRCDSEWSALFKQSLNWPEAVVRNWRDSVQDSLHEPGPDTTLPTIDSIGLSILRGPKAAIVNPGFASGEEHLSGLHVTENPFTRATEVKFTVADYGLVTFQLFDVLGHSVTSNGLGQVLDPGEHTFEIDGSKLSTGNYIARLSYHNGDVKSVKVSKE